MIVTELKAYGSVPGLRVLETVAPLAQSIDGKISLDGLTVECGDGRQPAAAPFYCRARAAAGPLTLTLSREKGPPPVTLQVPVEARESNGNGSPGRFATPPVHVTGAVQLIEGPFDVAAGRTEIEVEGTFAMVFAQTPRAVFWGLPSGTRPGPHRVGVRSGGRRASLPISVVRLGLAADRLNLDSGEETAFHAVLSGLDSVPESAWTSAIPTGLVDSEKLARVAPGFQPPPPGGPGVILVAIENVSRDTISLEGSSNEIILLAVDRRSVRDGVFRYDGRIRSKRGGPFEVRATVVPLLTPLPGEESSAALSSGASAASVLR